MKIKGMDHLSKHVPELNSASGKFRIALTFAGQLTAVTLYFILTDNIPTWSIDSQIIVMSLGFLLLSLFFSHKKIFQEKYKELAYRNAFARYAMPGLALIFGAVAHSAYMNGPDLPVGWWTSLFQFLGGYWVIVGAILWLRSIAIFGVDNLNLLYVYHPEESRLIDSSIFSVLRHPIYASLMRICAGLALLNANGNSLAFIFFLPLGLIGWVRLVEEKELIERFGDSYLEYRKRVPTFTPRLGSYKIFFKFLITGG